MTKELAEQTIMEFWFDYITKDKLIEELGITLATKAIVHMRNWPEKLNDYWAGKIVGNAYWSVYQ